MRHSIATAAVVAVAGVATVAVGAPAAYAKTVDVTYHCKTPIGDKSAVDPIDIKAVKSGSGYKITMIFKDWNQLSGKAKPRGFDEVWSEAKTVSVEPDWS